MSAEEAEGFPKPGTTLEGRVALLLRLMGYKVSRNVVLKDHEIDVYAESEEGKRIIVECKEYYSQLINRDLILIFATKVRDIDPDEAWFVTIYDFEPSALGLCKRYGIRPINGYDLEELEDKAAKGTIKLGLVPPEDRLMRILQRQRTKLSREKRRLKDLKRVAGQIYELAKTTLDLPPFLFPMLPSDLERRNIWMNELEAIPKTSLEGEVEETIVNINSLSPGIRGFKVLTEKKIPISPIISFILILLSIFLFLTTENWIYSVIVFISAVAILIPYKILIWKYSKTTLKAYTGIQFLEDQIHIPQTVGVIPEKMGDLNSKRLINVPAFLVDKTVFGHLIDSLIEKATGKILGVKFRLNPEIAEETGFDEAIIPVERMRFYFEQKMSEIQVYINAIYILSENFLKEESID